MEKVIMRKTFLDWILYILLYLWQLPQNIVGLVFLLYFKIFHGATLIDQTKWSAAYSSKGMAGGISLGAYCFLSESQARRKENIAHELLGHTPQSRLLGPLYLIVIGIPSLLNATFDFTKCYFDFFTERSANRNAGLGVDEFCNLYFLNKEENKES